MEHSNRSVEYELDEVDINKSVFEKDLRVMVNKDLKQRQKCISVPDKTNKVLGFISAKVILHLYIGLVRPHLNYTVQFWSTYCRIIDYLESIQRRVTK